MRISAVLASIQTFRASVMIVRSFIPFSNMKYTMAVHANPPNKPIFHLSRLLYSNVKTSRDINWTNVPNTKAIATERNMPSITERALSAFNKSPIPSSLPGAAILNNATTNVAPNSSNTIDTVVEVGIPSELKISNNMMSVTMTAINIVTTS